MQMYGLNKSMLFPCVYRMLSGGIYGHYLWNEEAQSARNRCFRSSSANTQQQGMGWDWDMVACAFRLRKGTIGSRNDHNPRRRRHSPLVLSI
jgi:hypothetical protein